MSLANFKLKITAAASRGFLAAARFSYRPMVCRQSSVLGYRTHQKIVKMCQSLLLSTQPIFSVRQIAIHTVAAPGS